MKKHGTNTIVKCAEHTLGLLVLLRGVRTGEAKLNVVFGEEETEGSRIKFFCHCLFGEREWVA